jgi:hypothetical protein
MLYFELPRNNYADLIKLQSNVIRICRVLCIYFMTYVHVHLFLNQQFQNTAYYKFFNILFVDIIGRSSVPLLSVISGILMIGYFQRRKYVDAMKDRGISIILPFITWNVIGLSLFIIKGGNIDISKIPNLIFAITSNSFYVPLTFLRDIYVISLLTPLLIYLIRKFGILAFLSIILITQVVDLAPFILRNQILLYFSLGIYIGLFTVKMDFNQYKALAFGSIAVAILLTITLINESNPDMYRFIHSSVFDDIIRRPLCAAYFWILGSVLVQSESFKNMVLSHLEPSIFLCFLSHGLVSLVIGSTYAHINILHTPVIYFMVWLLIPLIALVFAIVFHRLLKQTPKTFSLLFMGK